jgi:hypothetical protein
MQHDDGPEGDQERHLSGLVTELTLPEDGTRPPARITSECKEASLRFL